MVVNTSTIPPEARCGSLGDDGICNVRAVEVKVFDEKPAKVRHGCKAIELGAGQQDGPVYQYLATKGSTGFTPFFSGSRRDVLAANVIASRSHGYQHFLNEHRLIPP
jgi:hypothetical protein